MGSASNQPENWEEWARENGEVWLCEKLEHPTEMDYEVIGDLAYFTMPDPTAGYMWRLLKVKAGQVDTDTLYWNPIAGEKYPSDRDSISHVILCEMKVPLGALLVQKKGINDALVAGAVFTITPGDISMTEIEPGVFCVDELYSNVEYTITETTPPPGYFRDDPFVRKATPVAGTDCDENKPMATVFRNTPVPGKVKIYKVDGINEPLAGVTFSLTDGGSYDETCTTDANGYCGFYAVPLGDYTLDEDGMLPGYTLGEVKLNGEVLPNGLPHPFTIGLGTEPAKGQTFTFDVENLFGDEWCSPGFWSNNPLRVAQTGVVMGQLYNDLFEPVELNPRRIRDGVNPNPTLQMVLDAPQDYGGDAFNNVGDLLSIAHEEVNFDGKHRIENSCPLSADASRWYEKE